jgi:hypothetical protein
MEESMFAKGVVFSVIGLSMLALACSDDVTRVADNRGAIPPGWESDISGVWDFVGSVQDSSESLAGTLTIDRQVFILQFQEGGTLHYSAVPSPSLSVSGRTSTYSCGAGGAGTAGAGGAAGAGGVAGAGAATGTGGCTMTTSTYEYPYQLTRDALGVSLGVIPSDAGGTWGLTDQDRSVNCAAALDPDSFAASCSYAGGYGPFEGRLDAVRTRVLPSVFGELGGVWELASNGGRTGGCTATFSDNNFNAHCEGTGTSFDGAISFTLSENIGSGFSPEGLEILATRR